MLGDSSNSHISLSYVLQTTIGAQQRTQAALKQMNVHQTPRIFMQFLDDIKSLYDSQEEQIQATIKKY